MDNQLSMVSQVNHISRAYYIDLRNVGHIMLNLTEDVAASLVHALISSKLDNANILQYGVHEKAIRKLQLIQTNVVQIVTHSKNCLIIHRSSEKTALAISEIQDIVHLPHDFQMPSWKGWCQSLSNDVSL